MIKKVLTLLTTAVICLGAYMLVTAPTATSLPVIPTPTPVAQVAPNPAPPVTTDPKGNSTVATPGVLEQFGPPGVLITTILTGILMITKSINEGKKIDVTTYKERAADAEARSDIEIGKVHKKLEELNEKLDEVIADRDEYRDLLEQRKAHFTEQILAMEKRHQKELEDMHSALMIEVHTRHRLERLLAENGITIPETPPPYTKAMKDAVTVADSQEATRAVTATSELRIISEFQE